MAIDDLYKVAVMTLQDGQECVNVMYMRQTTANGADNAQAAATTLCPILAAVYQTFIGRTNFNRVYQVNTTLVSKLVSDMGEWSVQSLTDGPNFTRMPTVVATTMSIYTGLTGRDRRGRIFVAGIGQEAVTGGVMNSTGLAAASNFVTAMTNAVLGDAPSSGYQLGVFSRKHYNQLLSIQTAYFKKATRIAMKPIIGTMHSRKVGLGA